LKAPFELILYKFPREVLEAYCASKGAVWPNSPGDVSFIEAKLCLAQRLVTEDRQRNVCRPTSTVSDHRCGTIPFAVMWTSGMSNAKI
jgi:hypothetical protein